MKTLYHFQNDCEFHPLRCFKCKELVRRAGFVQHYVLVCRESPSSSSPAHVPYKKVGWDASTQTHGSPSHGQQLQGNTKEFRIGSESACRILKNIEKLVEDKMKEKGAKLDALSKKLDSYIRKQDDVQCKVNACLQATAKILQQLEELRSDIPRVANDVRVIREG